jgi:ATP-dependent Lon protease
MAVNMSESQKAKTKKSTSTYVFDRKLNRYFSNIVVYKGIENKFNLKNVDHNLVENYINSEFDFSKESELPDIAEKTESFFKKHYPGFNSTNKIKSEIKFETLNKGKKYKLIDKVKVKFDDRKNKYLAETLISEIKKIKIDEEIIKENRELLDNGLWCEFDIVYKNRIKRNGKHSIKNSEFYYEIKAVKPLELTDNQFEIEKEKLKKDVSRFTQVEWINLLLRSIGIEPVGSRISIREKVILLMRLLPLVEKNFNLVELGLPGTGKSYLHMDLSKDSYLLSGAETTRAQLFYDKAKRKSGLVNKWSAIVFDEVTGVDFDKDLLQYMKTFMGSGRFNADEETLFADASFVFNGNTIKEIDNYLSSSHLFKPLPSEMHDTAFLDRIHCYLPGWEINFDNSSLFTEHLGFTRDFFFKFLRFLRAKSNADILKNYDIKLSSTLSGRDKKAVEKNFSGLMKLLYPFGADWFFGGDNPERISISVNEILKYALEMRKRVNEQQKRISETANFDDKKFKYKYQFDEINFFEIKLPETDIYRKNDGNRRADIKEYFTSEEMTNINRKLIEKLKTSDVEEFVLNKPSRKFALTIKLNSILAEFTDYDNDEISDSAEKEFSNISNGLSENNLIKKYIDTYINVEDDLISIIEFIHNYSRYSRIYNLFSRYKDHRINQKDLEIRGNECSLKILDLREVKVWYRTEGRFDSVRCEYGGFIIKIDHKTEGVKENTISYSDRKNFF